MELKIEQVAIPEKIAFNYEELKQELSDKVKMYETLVYTDDQIKSAKADRADLNRLKKALNDERIRREKEYMQPFNVFKAQIDEIIGIIDKPVRLIDERIKDFEEQQKQEKKQKIEEYFSSIEPPEWLHLSMFFDERWLNASVTLKVAKFEISQKLAIIGNDLDTLSNLPEFAFEATETYKSTLDLNKSIAEGRRLSEMQKRKAEQEKARAEQERIRREQEEERKRILATVTEEEITESAEAYREAANVGGVHMPGFPHVESEGNEQPDEIPFDCMQYQAREEVVQSPKELPMYVCFKALLTTAQARELKAFFESRNIEFMRI